MKTRRESPSRVLSPRGRPGEGRKLRSSPVSPPPPRTRPQLSPAVGGRALGSSDVARPITVALGGQLPELRLRVRGPDGVPLAGKSAVLFSAPLDGSEFTSLVSSARIFHPRAVRLRDASSAAPSNFLSGELLVTNATLLGTSTRRFRVAASVDAAAT